MPEQHHVISCNVNSSKKAVVTTAHFGQSKYYRHSFYTHAAVDSVLLFFGYNRRQMESRLTLIENYCTVSYNLVLCHMTITH